MNLIKFNSLDDKQLYVELEKCCGSQNWINAMIKVHPYSSIEQIHNFADLAWSQCEEEDFLEAFNHHPQIGDISALKKKFASTAHWASTEQQGSNQATEEVLFKLKQQNTNYFNKFGFIFIVCATGKTAQQMLDLLENRIHNTKAQELHNAANEQIKITHLRIDKLFQ